MCAARCTSGPGASHSSNIGACRWGEEGAAVTPEGHWVARGEHVWARGPVCLLPLHRALTLTAHQPPYWSGTAGGGAAAGGGPWRLPGD